MAKNSQVTARVRKNTAGQKKSPKRSPVSRSTPVRSARSKTKVLNRGKPGPAARVEPEAAATRFTFHVNPMLTLACVSDEAPALFSLEAAARLTAVHPEMLRYYCRAGLIEGRHGTSETDLFFDESALEDVRRIEHYRRHLEVGRRALPLICQLRRDAERQHIEIQFLRYP